MEQFAVNLPSGKVLLGRSWVQAGSSRNLLIMTGMNEHATRYDDLAKFLNTKGIDVYVLDAVAQGLNAPKVEDQEKWWVGAYDDNVMAASLKIEQLKKDTGRPTSIMGHSMGSFMVLRYLELYPNTVDSVIECGSNGPAEGKMKMAYGLAKILVNKKNWDKPCKPLSNAGLGAYTKAVKNRKTDLDWLSYNEENVQKYIADPYCGHEDTGGFWHEFLKGMSTQYKKKELAKISPKERILVISGKDDPVGEMGKGPVKLADMYKKIGCNVELHVYEGMRHEIHNEKNNQIVYDQIAGFLAGGSK
jgi:alpha-beta hydrolase superfamily lysophospholipase